MDIFLLSLTWSNTIRNNWFYRNGEGTEKREASWRRRQANRAKICFRLYRLLKRREKVRRGFLPFQTRLVANFLFSLVVEKGQTSVIVSQSKPHSASAYKFCRSILRRYFNEVSRRFPTGIFLPRRRAEHSIDFEGFGPFLFLPRSINTLRIS